jgi:VIT1/CCC1 family predicted Fe2+/Mn2+ transporter
MSSSPAAADPNANRAPGAEAHPKPGILSDFILGSQDGIVNVLGIILGLAAARVDTRIILVAALAALGAESIAMAAVAYTSTLSRRRLYLSEVQRERHEMQVVPETERQEVRTVLAEWGYQGSDLEDLLERICRNPRAMLEFMMSFELKLAPVEESAPRASALLVGTATVLGHLIPLLPFFFVGGDVLLGATASVIVSGITLFAIGLYEARVTAGIWWSNGLQMLTIGLAGGFAGYLIGHFVVMAPGLGS